MRIPHYKLNKYSGNTYELCALKIDADGQSFMGFQKTITRLLNSHLYANHRTDSEFTSVSTASDDDSDDCWGGTVGVHGYCLPPLHRVFFTRCTFSFGETLQGCPSMNPPSDIVVILMCNLHVIIAAMVQDRSRPNGVLSHTACAVHQALTGALGFAYCAQWSWPRPPWAELRSRDNDIRRRS